MARWFTTLPRRATRMKWQLLAEFTPDAEGYDTASASALMTRVTEAIARCGEADEVARVRLVMGEGHTVLRLECCSERVRVEFEALGGHEV